MKNLPTKKKFKRNCYNCGKNGHMSDDCRAPRKDKKKGQANIVETTKEVDNLCGMLSQCNLIKNSRADG